MNDNTPNVAGGAQLRPWRLWHLYGPWNSQTCDPPRKRSSPCNVQTLKKKILFDTYFIIKYKFIFVDKKMCT